MSTSSHHSKFKSSSEVLLCFLILNSVSYTTGESWNGLLHCMKEQMVSSVIFFVSFNLVATLVFLNIFIAVILENFASLGVQ